MKTMKNLILALMVMTSAITKIEAQNIITCRGTGDTIILTGGVEPYTWVMDSTYRYKYMGVSYNVVFPKVITFATGSWATIQSLPATLDLLAVSGFPIYITDSIGDTLTIQNASELQYPKAIFTTINESSSLYCDGSISTQLIGGNIQSYWTNENLDTLLNTDSICPGTYTLYLTDTNSCKNTYTQTINAGPIPPTQQLCLITVDSANTHNLLVWEKNTDPAIDSFIIYREITTNDYQPIGTISKDSLSVFDDYPANPSSSGYRYKVSTKNKMNVESNKSNKSNYHNTIYLTNTSGNFNWTKYMVDVNGDGLDNDITPVASYDVYRDDNSTGNFNLIGSTTGNQFGFTDVQFFYFMNASYYVAAVMTSGDCNPTRSSFGGAHSNTKYTGSGTTEINQLNNHTVSIYPNPANDIINVNGIIKETVIHLYDVIGRLVIEKEISNDTTLDISQFKNGIYTIVIDNKTTKIVINH